MAGRSVFQRLLRMGSMRYSSRGFTVTSFEDFASALERWASYMI
jgi:hypothetical protein